MSRAGGRIMLAVLFGGLVATPLVLPFLSVLLDPSALAVWREGDRIFELLGSTLFLIIVTLALAMPLGVVTALLLQGATPGSQTAARALFAISLATPLPVTTVAWHAVRWGQWSPFAQGLFPAAILHALAGLPWVVLIVHAGLMSGDPHVADDARLHAGRFVQTWRVTLPSVRGFVILSGLWVAAQTASEIVVTDMLQVRTFAEEVYTQAVAPGTETGAAADTAVARAVAATLPMPFILVVMVLINLRQLRGRRVQSLRTDDHPANSRLAGALALAIALAVVGVPTVNLLLRCGTIIGGLSVASGIHVVGLAARENARLLVSSVIAAVFVGLGLSLLTGIATWRAIHRPILRSSIFVVAALAVAAPGPVIGLGVRSANDFVLMFDEKLGANWFRGILYDGPSLVPVAWAWAIRAWPLALAVWWPAVARLPRDFGESTRLETGSRLSFLRHEALPALWRLFSTAAVLVAIYCLGEISASRLVTTPGGQSFAHDVFARMHFGITPELAGMCVVLLIVVSAIAITIPLFMRPLAAR